MREDFKLQLHGRKIKQRIKCCAVEVEHGCNVRRNTQAGLAAYFVPNESVSRYRRVFHEGIAHEKMNKSLNIESEQ